MDNTILTQLISDAGASLYDTETVHEEERKIFRIYITAKGGVSLDLCTKITKIISPILDLDPPVGGEYTLEVSSPGIDRKLTSISHFAHSIDELAKIKLINGEKFKCKILSIEGQTITCYDKDAKQERQIDFNEISKAKTYFEW
ncbi:MAG: ribosome maturation factor [Epsilonproteobacteria bacterium]|nr:ribosome maturation factor [Campylobacterota bacterium]